MKYFTRKWLKFINEQKDSNEVVKIVLFKNNKILFLISKIDPYAGNLDLPGGHLHIKEDLETGLKREVKEETGLTIEKPVRMYKEDNITFYKGTFSGEITLSDEHSAYLLLNPSEINNKRHNISNILRKAVEKAAKD